MVLVEAPLFPATITTRVKIFPQLRQVIAVKVSALTPDTSLALRFTLVSPMAFIASAAAPNMSLKPSILGRHATVLPTAALEWPSLVSLLFPVNRSCRTSADLQV